MRGLLAALALSMILAWGAPLLGQRMVTPGQGVAMADETSVRGEDAQGGPRSSPSVWWKRVVRVVVVACVALLFVMAGLLLFENRFLFRPARAPLVSWQPPGLQVEECLFRSRDGRQLHGWWHPGRGSQDPSQRPVVLWCHGNAGNITHRAENMRMLAEQGLAVLLFDYRGYGKSQGKPSEAGLYLDAVAAHGYLVKQRAVWPGRIICFGRSLGAAVALHVALRQKVAGLIMESAFESVPAVARCRVPVLPVSPFMRNRFDNLTRVHRLAVPLLMTHGSRDGLVPIEHARAVFTVAPGPKQFYVIEGAGHNDTYEVGGDEYFGTLRRFCYECVAPDGEAVD